MTICQIDSQRNLWHRELNPVLCNREGWDGVVGDEMEVQAGADIRTPEASSC